MDCNNPTGLITTIEICVAALNRLGIYYIYTSARQDCRWDGHD